MSRPARRRAARLLTPRATLAALLLLAAGCGGEETDVHHDPHGEGSSAAPADAAQVLEQQRTQVRALAADLVRLLAAELEGTPSGARGRWRGCESVFPEGYGSFRYSAEGRVDAGPEARRPYLVALRPALEREGFQVGEPHAGPAGGTTLPVTRDGLTASVSEMPPQGDYVLVGVAGTCREVPAADREAWLTRQDPDPAIL